MADPDETTQQFVAAVRAAVRAEFESAQQAFWVPAERHYNEHLLLKKCSESLEEKEANHEFISAVRSGGRYAGKITFGAAILALAVFIGGAIWIAIVMAVQSR